MSGIEDSTGSPFGPRRGVFVPAYGLASSTLRARFARNDALRASRPPALRSSSGPHTVDEGVPGQRSTKEARVEAALLVADGPLSPRRLVQVAKLVDAKEARSIVETLNVAFDADGSTFRIEWVAAGFQMLSLHRYAPWLERLHERRARTRLSTPALETLVIVAHRQPVTRADIDAVRGSQSAELLRQLMERGLIRIVGEEDTLGRPYLYGTTRSFLEAFGLRTLADLPMAEELRRQVAESDEAEADSLDEGNCDDASDETAEAFDSDPSSLPDSGEEAGAEADESDDETRSPAA